MGRYLGNRFAQLLQSAEPIMEWTGELNPRAHTVDGPDLMRNDG
jgi:hypothetical protein